VGGWLGPERLRDGHGHRVTCRRKAKCELIYIAAEFFDLRESGPSAGLLRGQPGVISRPRPNFRFRRKADVPTGSYAKIEAQSEKPTWTKALEFTQFACPCGTDPRLLSGEQRTSHFKLATSVDETRTGRMTPDYEYGDQEFESVRAAPFRNAIDAETRRSPDASRRVASADRASHNLNVLR